jgi:hypothetical protein
MRLSPRGLQKESSMKRDNNSNIIFHNVMKIACSDNVRVPYMESNLWENSSLPQYFCDGAPYYVMGI